MHDKPKAVLFDIGNVLFTWDPEQLYGKLYGREGMERLFAEVDLHGMNLDIDRGANWRETVYATALRHPEHAEAVRLWHDRWIEMAQPAIPWSWSLLRALRRKGVPVFALSNFGVESFAYAQGIYPVLSEFDRLFISGHMKVVKPEPRIYEMVEEECGLSGSELFFTDDRPENIGAAEARGWRGHIFTGPEGLAACLVELELLDETEAAAP